MIDITAKGGNFEVGFGPMPNGTWPQETVDRLEFVGSWLRTNGEAIYSTRPWVTDREGDHLGFTRSKNGKYVYAINLRWPGNTLSIHTLRAAAGSQVYMLGSDHPLKWRQSSAGLLLDLGAINSGNRNPELPCAFKVQAE